MSAPADSDVRRVVELVNRRSRTDRKMGYGWMIAPFLPIILVTIILAAVLGIVVSVISKMGAVTQPQNFTSAGGAVASAIGGIAAIYGFAIVGGYFVLLLTALAFYYLIQRRNDHFARQQLLFSTLNQLLSNGTQVRPSETTSRLNHLSEDSVFEERQRAAGIWAIIFLFVSPIISLIIAYSLTQDLRKHEALQAEYRIALSEALRDAGYQPPTFATPRLHNRDPLLFVILSAITAGLFWIYWFYTLLHDYNEHFAQQAEFEDQIVNLFKPPAPASGRNCNTCGASIPENARFCPSCGTRSS